MHMYNFYYLLVLDWNTFHTSQLNYQLFDFQSFCASGRCVVEHENIIPDYSQIAPVISRDPLSKGSSFTFPTSS